MALTKAKKAELISKFEKIVKETPSLVFVAFKGLTVADTTAMRRQLRSQNVGYVVAKKTLLSRALRGGGIEGTLPELPGEIAVAYGVDPIAPAREIAGFTKKYKEMLSIVGGVFGGTYMDKNAMVEIASIPPIQVLYGQFANVVNSPIQGLVMALDQIAKQKN